jgi:hypothetical protein
MLKPPGTKRLELKCDILLSTFAFKFNWRCYTLARVHVVSRPKSRVGWVSDIKFSPRTPDHPAGGRWLAVGSHDNVVGHDRCCSPCHRMPL